MKRYYLAPVVGDGSMADPVRLDVAGDHVAVLDRAAGWGMALVSTPDHTVLLANPALDALPDLSPDARLSTLPAADRTRVQDALTRRGATVSVNWQNDPYRALLRGIGRRLDPAFDENRFDVSG